MFFEWNSLPQCDKEMNSFCFLMTDHSMEMSQVENRIENTSNQWKSSWIVRWSDRCHLWGKRIFSMISSEFSREKEKRDKNLFVEQLFERIFFHLFVYSFHWTKLSRRHSHWYSFISHKSLQFNRSDNSFSFIHKNHVRPLLQCVD